MKLRMKMLLLTGLTSFLILAAVMTLAMVCFLSFFSQLQLEGHRYSVNDVRTKVAGNMFHLRDMILSSYSRTNTIYTVTKVNPQDFPSQLKNRLKHSYGVSFMFACTYDLKNKQVFSHSCGYAMKRNGEVEETKYYLELLNSPEFLTLIKKAAVGKTDFIFRNHEECWIVNCNPDSKGSSTGRIFAVCMDRSYWRDRSAGYLLMKNDKIVAEDYRLLSKDCVDNIRRGLRKIAKQLETSKAEEVILEQLPDARSGREWFAAGLCIRIPSNRGETIRLVHLYEYNSVMPLLPKLIHRRIKTLTVCIVIFMIAGLALLVLPLFLVSKQISAPIAQAVSFANDVAAGDFTPRPDESCGILEIDQLLKSLDHLRDRLNAMIGKLKRSHIREQEARKEAEKSNRLKSDFLSVLYWEYREPLNTLIGFTTLLKEKLDRNEKIDAEYMLPVINAFQTNLHDVSKICEILRELSLLNVLQENMRECETVDVFKMFHELNPPLREGAAAIGINLEFHYSSDLPALLVLDKRKTTRMLSMLVEALVSYMHSGESLVCSCTIPKKKTISFCCSGKGNNPLPGEYLLSRSSTRSLREFPTANGIIYLSIIKYIASVIEASFDVTSDNDQFAVTITMPFTEADVSIEESGIDMPLPSLSSKALPQQNESLSFRNLASISRSSKSPIRIVVAEDNEFNRLLFEMMLKDGNFTVSSAVGPDEVRKILEQMPAQDILLLDLHMQGLADPCSFLSEIRRLPAGRDLFIIVLTASLKDGERNRLISAGADACFLKPLNVAELAGAVHSYIKRKQKSS